MRKLSQQKLPQVHFWTDRIDEHVISVHAVRGWADRPSNGVFALVPCPEGRECYLAWPPLWRELTAKLHERERILFSWYGRDWRNHLCDRIREADKIPMPA